MSRNKSDLQKLLDALLKGNSISTFEARHKLDIVGVAPRIFELRHIHGHNIKTFWTKALNPGGGYHRIARYVLFPKKSQGENNAAN